MSNKDYTKYSREVKEPVVEPVVEEVVNEVVETPVEEPVVEQTTEPEVIKQVEPVVENSEMKIGFVTGCSKLNVRCEPWPKAPIICEIEQNTEVEIDMAKSTSDFYKVYLASGIEGFCVKTYITEK